MTLNNRNLFFHSSGGWESEIRTLAGLVPPGAVRESLFHTFLLARGGLLATLGVLALYIHHSNFCIYLHTASSTLVFVPSFLYTWLHATFLGLIVRTSISELGPILIQYDFNLFISQRPYPQTRLHSSFQADMNIWGALFNTVQKEGSKCEANLKEIFVF